MTLFRLSTMTRAAVTALTVAAVTTAGLTVAELGSVPAAHAAPVLPEHDRFYSYSGSLKKLKPGEVIKTRESSFNPAGVPTPFAVTQALYRTTGQLGQPTLAVVSVIHPLVPLQATKIVSYQTAYDGLAGKCDPSYLFPNGSLDNQTIAAQSEFITNYLALGYTVVSADYEGVSRAFGAGQQSGYGVLDGIRAAQSLLKVKPARTPVAMLGYSGGSIASEYAAELAPTYAPELDLRGVAAGGVPAHFYHSLEYVDGTDTWSGAIPTILEGLSRGYQIDITKYLTPFGKAAINEVSDRCLDPANPLVTVKQMVKPQYRRVALIPRLRAILNNAIMSHTGTPEIPMLLSVGNSDGTGDGVMIAQDVRGLARVYCERGLNVQFIETQQTDHVQAAVPFEVSAQVFVNQVLNGIEPTSGCDQVGRGNDLNRLPRVKASLKRFLAHRYGVVITLKASNDSLRKMNAVLAVDGRIVDGFLIPKLTTHGVTFQLRSPQPIAPDADIRVIVRGGRTVTKVFKP